MFSLLPPTPHQCRLEGFNYNSMKDCTPLSTRGPQFIQQEVLAANASSVH